MTKFLNSVRNDINEVINGDYGRKICGALEVGRKIGEGFRLISAMV